MHRNVGVFIIGLAAIANLHAGYIQIGGNTGLTSTNSNGMVGTTGGFGENAYGSTLWQGTAGGVNETGSGVLCAGATVSTCSATTGMPSGEASNEFAAANGVTFSMLNEQIGNTNENLWVAPQDGTSTVTIPIGIFGVTNAYTMINDEYGVANQSPTTVTFDFLNPANDLTFTLVNGTVIRDTFDCTGGTGLGVNCTQYASSLVTTNMYGENGASLGAIAPTVTPNVTAFNVWTGTYSYGTGNYTNTNGNLYLDAQDFYLGPASANDTLESIVISDTAGSAVKTSRDGLSAITVQTTSAPEPSTVVLFVTGIGAVAMRRRPNQL